MTRELLKKALDALEKIIPELDRRIDRGEKENYLVKIGTDCYYLIKSELSKPDPEPAMLQVRLICDGNWMEADMSLLEHYRNSPGWEYRFLYEHQQQKVSA